MNRLTLVTVAVAAFALGAAAMMLFVGEAAVEYVEIEKPVDVERIVEKPVDRIIEVATACPLEHTDTEAQAAKMRRLAELETTLREMTAPELVHPLTGLSLLQQVKLRVVFDHMRPSAKDILEGRADSPNPRTAEFVRLLLGDDEAARLVPILRAEFDRYRRDHARWAVFDPLAQRLFWNLCGEL